MSDAPPPSFTGPAPPQPQPPPPALPQGRERWPPWLSVLAFVTGFGVTIVVGLFVFILASAFGAERDSPGIGISLTFVQNAALVGAAYFFASMGRGRVAAADFGLRATRLWRSVGLLVAVWIGFLILSAIWAAVFSLDQQQDLPKELGADGPLLNALVVVVLVTVVAPLGEELFFRGFFFGALRNWRGPWLAAIITGLVFGGVHLGSSPVGYLVPLMIFGVGLCLLYEWTGSLYPAIALHALNNSIALGANLKWDWQIPAMMVGSTAAALLCAWLLARAMGNGPGSAPASSPAPGTA
ncbi:MAG TPA: type II CAAX endopeptidase family protein [Solirubrobacteraceae bacterium]|nr:type II CAAX endopeptidase family protein [Solirubrobacteraceae bacterium]